MSRTNTTDLKTLVPDTTLDDTSLERFITTANRLVTDRLKGQGVGASMLEEIELYLAAHFLVMVEEKGGLDSEEQGEATNSYKGSLGENLASSRFGMQAKAMDPTGKLASAGQRRARFTTMPRSE